MRRLATDTKRITDSVYNVNHNSTRDIWRTNRMRNVYAFAFENSGTYHCFLLSSYLTVAVQLYSGQSICFHEQQTVLFWFVASKFSGLQFPKVLFTDTRGDTVSNTGLFIERDNGQFIIYRYNRLEFGERYDVYFTVTGRYRNALGRGKVLLWLKVEWSKRLRVAREFHNRSHSYMFQNKL